MALAVEMLGITQVFGNLVANDNVDFQAEWAKVHGICGENGAGKTTLMNILYGLHQPVSGIIKIDGKQVQMNSSKDAIALGIGMVHQHFSLVNSMTVAQNIVMGNPPHKSFGLVDIKKSNKLVNEISEKYCLPIDPAARVKDLPVGLQQRVEILKALYLGANILIMDEPTAVLTPQEIDKLFETLRELRRNGKTIILITHKLKEVKEITDEITIMRLGKVMGHVKTESVTEFDVARMMVGRDVLMSVPKDKPKLGNTVLSVKEICCKDIRGVQVVNNVSFDIKEGEIVGIAGVQGNGQTELIEAVTGLRKITSGSIFIHDKPLKSGNLSAKCREAGVGHIPEDRQTVGAARQASIRDNYLLNLHKRSEFGKKGFLKYKKVNEKCVEQLKKYDVRYNKITDMAGSLSGGNLQKVIIAREMYIEPKLIIAAQPTRGLDIGATEYIHKQLVEHRDKGNAVLLVTNELSEVMSLSDRILVVFKGSIIGEIAQSEATEEQIGLWMAGILTSSLKGDL